MVTVLGTLGFHEGKFLPPLLAIPDVRKVILYYAPGETPVKERKVQSALRGVRRRLTKTRATLIEVQLPDPWDVSAMLAAFLEDLRREGPDNCVFNLTGGTKTMAIAASFACLASGARAVYVREESDRPEPIDVPLPTLALRSPFTPAQARVLQAIAHRTFSSETELAKTLRLSVPTTSHHLRRLHGRRAVAWEGAEDGRIRRAKITKIGEVLLLLHERLER